MARVTNPKKLGKSDFRLKNLDFVGFRLHLAIIPPVGLCPDTDSLPTARGREHTRAGVGDARERAPGREGGARDESEEIRKM